MATINVIVPFLPHSTHHRAYLRYRQQVLFLSSATSRGKGGTRTWTERGVPAQVLSSSLDHGSKLRSPSPVGYELRHCYHHVIVLHNCEKGLSSGVTENIRTSMRSQVLSPKQDLAKGTYLSYLGFERPRFLALQFRVYVTSLVLSFPCLHFGF
ncbi:hypothetical protein TNCV_3628601 [Trichonephila clavipes]|nr:hypothetical protein TNCV_3628601 [Trichonephila clavipes]